MLSILIPRKKSPDKDIDVYFQLVIDELAELWSRGVLTHDVAFGRKFTIYVALLWTISD
jgi:hypothetical protein